MQDFLVKLKDAKPWLLKPDPKPGDPPPLPTWEEMVAKRRAEDARKAAERAAKRQANDDPHSDFAAASTAARIAPQ